MKFTTPFGLYSQTTRLFEKSVLPDRLQGATGLSPSAMSRSKELAPRAWSSTTLSSNYNSATAVTPPADSKVELFPLHSQLLGESSLVSFPPLTYMLKFSG